jgi:hypothetical protein
MNLQLLCKSIETRVAKEISTARSQEEKALILTSALYEYGHSVLTALDSLSPAADAGIAGYRQAQAAATELLTFLVLPFIGSCSTYKQGITVLEDLGEIGSDESLRRRLVTYTNQLKRRWQQADPSALPITLRPARYRPSKKQSLPIGTGVLVVLLFAIGLYFFARFDLTSFVFSGGNAPQVQVQAEKSEEAVPPEPQTSSSPPSTGPPQPAPVPSGEYFSYTDAKGVVHLGNNPNDASPQAVPRVPQQTPRQLSPNVPQQLSQQAPQQVAPSGQVPAAAASGSPPAVVVDKIKKYDSAGLNEFESCRCKNGIATRGDKSQEVLLKCDQPAATISTRTRNCNVVWLYNFGPNEFMQGVCFDRGRVNKVISLDYGF